MRHYLLPYKSGFLLLAWLLAAQVPARAQQVGPAPAPGIWVTVGSEARLTRRLGLHADLHWRGAQKASAAPAQNLLRAGLNVYLGRRAMVTAGYAYAHFVLAGDQSAPASVRGARERRLFQQFQFGEQTGALWTRHRYRLEERWLSAVGKAPAAYRTRLRYQLRVLVPLRRDHRLTPGTAYLVGANELFFNLGAAPSFFDQNRASLLLGWQLSRTAALEAGLVSQAFSADAFDGGAGTVLQVGFAFSPDIRHGNQLRMRNEE